jgi:hypothetical protein
LLAGDLHRHQRVEVEVSVHADGVCLRCIDLALRVRSHWGNCQENCKANADRITRKSEFHFIAS